MVTIHQDKEIQVNEYSKCIGNRENQNVRTL